MPELPEVETVKNVLKESCLDKKIISINLLYDLVYENRETKDLLINNSITDILRKGKYLIFVLTKGYLVSHLRMEGKYYYKLNPLLDLKHICFFIQFEDNSLLYYKDVRKFGRIHYFSTYEEVLEYMNLGPDANSYIDPLYFYSKIKNSKKEIKKILLEQSIIAGIGNIYADEILYKSNINPLIKAEDLNIDNIKNILNNSKEILDKAILNKGTTIRSYTSSLGVTGNYQNYLEVHTKNYCPLKHKILKTKIGGRGTYFCPICQAKNKLVIGITGGIASGKSTLINYLKKLNYPISDSDSIVKEAYKDINIINEIKANFPNTILNNQIDKVLLSNIVFKDKNKLNILNNIIHPYVIARLKEDIKNNMIIFLDIPLLFEANLEYLCDKIICIYTSKDIQIERIIKRDHKTKQEALEIINNQLDTNIKINKSDYSIDNSYDLKDTINLFNDVLLEIFTK